MLEHLPILNVDVAVARLRPERDLYHLLLRQFQQLHGQDMERVETALRSGQEHELTRLLHALRGAAVILGADRLYATARTLTHSSLEPSVSLFEMLRKTFELTLSAVQHELGDSS